MRKTIFAAVAASAIAMATGAYAAVPACTNNDVVINAVDCSGFYEGNLLNAAHNAEQIAALNDLIPSFTWNPADGYVEFQSPLMGATTLNFATTFYGLTYIGIHFGAGKGEVMPPGVGDQATAFYVVDFGATGGNTLMLNYAASSNVAVYSTKDKPFDVPVPEPATWAMMILGFGGVGAMIRRRRQVLSAV